MSTVAQTAGSSHGVRAGTLRALIPGTAVQRVRSSWVPQAAGDSVRRPEPPAEEAAVKGRHVHGSGGRHQVATPLSLSPLTMVIAAILSAHHGSHDFQSNECMEC